MVKSIFSPGSNSEEEKSSAEQWVVRRAKETVLPQIDALKNEFKLNDDEAMLLFAITMLSSISYNMSVAVRAQKEEDKKKYGRPQ